MAEPFTVANTAVLTSTTSSQAVTFPATDGLTNQVVIYNGAANPVYVAKGASVAIPGGTPTQSTAGIICVAPSTSQVFTLAMNGGGTLAYIAATAGGTLVITTGTGF